VGEAPSGRTMLKRRQLRSLGWRVAPVPYLEWNGLAQAGSPTPSPDLEVARQQQPQQQQRLAYLAAVLDKAADST